MASREDNLTSTSFLSERNTVLSLSAFISFPCDVKNGFLRAENQTYCCKVSFLCSLPTLPVRPRSSCFSPSHTVLLSSKYSISVIILTGKSRIYITSDVCPYFIFWLCSLFLTITQLISFMLNFLLFVFLQLIHTTLHSEMHWGILSRVFLAVNKQFERTPHDLWT